MQGANSALQCCTSGLYNSRCHPENNTLKSTNSALASAAEEISAVILHHGIDQKAYLQTCVFTSTLSEKKPVGEKSINKSRGFFATYPLQCELLYWNHYMVLNYI